MSKPSSYQKEIYAKHSQSAIPFDSTQWEPLAKDALSKAAWGYVYGSAGARETLNNNLASFKKWGLVPSRLVPTAKPDLITKVFGQTLSSPLALAPVGVLQIFHDDKERGVAEAAKELSIPYILSTAASSSIEEAAKYNGDGLHWYQLYWPLNEHNDITISLLNRAKKSGYKALFVTLDTYILGWRPSDLDNAGYNPFLKPDHVGVEIGFTDPVFREHFKTKHGKEVEEDVLDAAREWAEIVFPGVSHSWEDVNFLKEHWDGPIVLKGIQTVRDAKKAVDMGMAGIVVSNHGGRQVDGCVASLDVLPEIAATVGDKLDIFFDSGIRSGTDVAKALALGAKCCLIGRPYVYGLALGGKDGVTHVLKSILADLDLTLQLSGIPSVSKQDLNTDVIRRIT